MSASPTLSTRSDPAGLSALEPSTSPSVAVLVPCYNEELTVAAVIAAFHDRLPDAEVFVFDNSSTDGTVAAALRSGATVMREPRRGKGWVVQSMFEQVDADVYVMVDGDATYPAEVVDTLIAPILEGRADMVVGSRLQKGDHRSFKALNHLGNRLFLFLLNTLFGARLTDVLSGYRAFTRHFVKNVPLAARGFEIEVELTIKALQRGYRVVEVPCELGFRPAGSHSKIRLWQDGFLILNTILALVRDYKPLTFFGALGLMAMGAGAIPGVIVISEFARTGMVPRLPSAVLAVGLMLTGVILVVIGLVLHTIIRRFQELEYQMRLNGSAVRRDPRWRGR